MIICSGLLIFLIDKEHKTSCTHFVKSGLVNRSGHLRTVCVHFEKKSVALTSLNAAFCFFVL